MSTVVKGVARLFGAEWLIEASNVQTMVTRSQNPAIVCRTLTMKEDTVSRMLDKQVTLNSTAVLNESTSGTPILSVGVAA